MDTARVFTNGRSQAVRIPREFRFQEDEVAINRIGGAVVLTPLSQLKELYRLGISSFTPDFMADGRPDEIATMREEL